MTSAKDVSLTLLAYAVVPDIKVIENLPNPVHGSSQIHIPPIIPQAAQLLGDGLRVKAIVLVRTQQAIDTVLHVRLRQILDRVVYPGRELANRRLVFISRFRADRDRSFPWFQMLQERWLCR